VGRASAFSTVIFVGGESLGYVRGFFLLKGWLDVAFWWFWRGDLRGKCGQEGGDALGAFAGMGDFVGALGRIRGWNV
jgi:hypothetical protein